MTGIVGVNRDILGTGLGARPIANTDVFCFGPPDWSENYLLHSSTHLVFFAVYMQVFELAVTNQVFQQLTGRLYSINGTLESHWFTVAQLV